MRYVMIWIVIALITLALAGSYILDADASRFRLTIEINTPEGMKSGSSVIQTQHYASGTWGPVEAKNIVSQAKGTAVVIDLGDNRQLLGILGFGPDGSDESKLFGLVRAALAGGEPVSWKDDHKLKGRGELHPDYVPALILFSDANDPKTARLVVPTDFSRMIGPGYSFKRAFIETTKDPISRDIADKLPWWGKPDRPAVVAWKAWGGGTVTKYSIGPERLFLKE